MYDQLTPAALGCYGNRATQAPHIDRLAADGVVFDAAYSNSPLCTPARYCMMTGQLPSATRGYDNAAYLAEHRADLRALRAGRRLPHGAVGQDALRRPRPAARLRGAADHRHLPGRLRLDARLARARRAHRLVVPQHGQRHRRRRGRGDQPAAVRRRGRLPRRPRAARRRPRRRRPAVPAGRELHPPARPVRHPPARTGTATTGVEIPLPVVAAADVPLDPHTAAAARRLRHGTQRPSPTTTCARARRAYLGNVSYVDDWTGRLVGTLESLGLRRRHGGGAARRPRRHARRARPLVQDELLRGLGAHPAGRPRARSLRAAPRRHARVAGRPAADDPRTRRRFRGRRASSRSPARRCCRCAKAAARHARSSASTRPKAPARRS